LVCHDQTSPAVGERAARFEIFITQNGTNAIGPTIKVANRQEIRTK
jgi:hypothetical protein